MANYKSMRESDYAAAAYEAAGIDVEVPEILHDGDGYWIEQEYDGSIWFCTESDRAALAHPLNDYSYIKYDENKGWCYKNGRALPWKD